MVASQIACRDFSAKTLRALAKRGLKVVSVQAVPGSGDMPWANADRGYLLNNGRLLTFAQVLGAAK